MIIDGLVLATITGAAFYFIFQKLPRRLRKFLTKHILLTDTVACLLTYMLFGGTVTALFAAAWLSLIISILLILVRNPQTSALLTKASLQLVKVKERAAEWLEEILPPEDDTRRDTESTSKTG